MENYFENYDNFKNQYHKRNNNIDDSKKNATYNNRSSLYLNQSDMSYDSSFVLSSEAHIKEEEKAESQTRKSKLSSSNCGSINSSRMSIIEKEEGMEYISTAIDNPDSGLTFWDNIKKNFSTVRNVLKFNFIEKENLIKLEDFREINCFGHKYSYDKYIFNNKNSLSTKSLSNLKKELIWFSYRNNFEAIMYGKMLYSSDAGWGCMIRAGQMIFAKAIIEYMKTESNIYSNKIIDNTILLFFDNKIPFNEIDKIYQSFAYLKNNKHKINIDKDIIDITDKKIISNNDFCFISSSVENGENKSRNINMQSKKNQNIKKFEIREDYISSKINLVGNIGSSNNKDERNDNYNNKNKNLNIHYNKEDKNINFPKTTNENILNSKSNLNKLNNINEADYTLKITEDGFIDIDECKNLAQTNKLGFNINKNLTQNHCDNNSKNTLLLKKPEICKPQKNFQENNINIPFSCKKDKKVENNCENYKIQNSNKSKIPKYVLPPFSVKNICDYSYKYSKGAGMWFSNNMIINILKDINQEINLFNNLKIKHFDACLKTKEILNELYERIVCTCDKDTHLVEFSNNPLDNANELSLSDYDIIEQHVELKFKSINCKCQCFSDKNLLRLDESYYMLKSKFVVFVSFRLGLNILEPLYYDPLLEIFDIKHNIGGIGGKGTQAIYFIGKHNRELVYLDPHYVQESDISVEDLLKNIDTYTANKFFSIKIENCTPSLTLGIFCANTNDYFETLEQIKNSKKLKEIIKIL